MAKGDNIKKEKTVQSYVSFRKKEVYVFTTIKLSKDMWKKIKIHCLDKNISSLGQYFEELSRKDLTNHKREK